MSGEKNARQAATFRYEYRLKNLADMGGELSKAMHLKTFEQNGRVIALIDSDQPLITDAASALGLLADVRYETGADRIALNRQALSESFFILSTCLAGEVLQKFINYHAKLAVYGDFSEYTSKPLRDFIRESNRGNDIFFTATADEAVKRLAGVQ